MQHNRVFKAAAYLTLLVDAYLALASVATGMMPPEYHYYLPPFALAAVSAMPKVLMLVVVAWTTLLAVGCLSEHSKGLRPANVYAVLMTLLIIITVLLGIALVFLRL